MKHSLTDCFFKEGNLQFAMADYHQALELDPTDVAIHARLAAIQNEHGLRNYQDKNYPVCTLYNFAFTLFKFRFN